MKEELLESLRRLTAEERENLSESSPSHRALYAKSGRFIIGRRQMSELTQGEETAAVSLREHPRFREFPEHTHDYIEIMYVCQGSLTHRIRNQSVTLEQDDLILFNRHCRHSVLAAGEEDIGINLIVSADLFESIVHSIRLGSRLPDLRLEELLQRDRLPFRVFHGGKSLAVQNLMESMILSALLEDSPADPFTLQQSVTLLLCLLLEMDGGKGASSDPPSHRELTARRLLNYIRTSYSSATLTEASRMLGLSPTYLSRFTHSCFGVPFKELLMRERFSAACRLLSSTDMPIGDVINQVGYENSSYFHKEFKRRYSLTPREYRQRASESNRDEGDPAAEFRSI